MKCARCLGLVLAVLYVREVYVAHREVEDALRRVRAQAAAMRAEAEAMSRLFAEDANRGRVATVRSSWRVRRGCG